MGSSVSNTVQVTIGAVLPAPVLSAVPTENGSVAALTWSASAGASAYQLYRSVDGGAWALYQTVTGLSFNDPISTGPVDFGSVYAYYVVAVSNAAASGPSNSVTVTIDAGV